jgi:hypothetical protein
LVGLERDIDCRHGALRCGRRRLRRGRLPAECESSGGQESRDEPEHEFSFAFAALAAR